MNMEFTVELDALQTKTGNFFVYFHEYYGAYFNAELSAFTDNPLRVEAQKEWDWAKDTWQPSPETLYLTKEQSENLLKLVENHPEHGLGNIRDLTEEEYSDDQTFDELRQEAIEEEMEEWEQDD